MQEGQPDQIVHCGNISFVATLDAVLQCCRIFEGQFAGAADGVDLDPQPVDGIYHRGFPDLGRVADPDALAGLGHPLRVATRRSAATSRYTANWKLQRFPGHARPAEPQLSTRGILAAVQTAKPTIYAAVQLVSRPATELAIVRH